MRTNLVIFILVLATVGCRGPLVKRTTLSLNGEWQLSVTPLTDQPPVDYQAIIQVPGLVDLAVPAMDTVETSDKVYWYRRNFLSPEGTKGIARLKINKAKYHTRVFINGKFVGENPYSFTPTEIDLAGSLNPAGEPNEIVISVGCRNNLPDTVADGNDFEKDFYYPGIYDDVNVIFSDYPYINNVQCAPQVREEKLRVRAELLSGTIEGEFLLRYLLTELASGMKVSSGELKVSGPVADFEIDLPGCNLWSPEDPFLYKLELSTSSDHYSTRFGMRSFEFDPVEKVALLNGEPYYLRGTNICIYRFFDDPERLEQPWQDDWTTRLHKQFKTMHWNSIRYCIGFPPERWYEIADSLGFLIADEFPLWYGNDPATIDSLDKRLTSQSLAGEYRAWMRERWNHPCVVIWDAQNESVTDITGEAIGMVRELDLSDRPWENGWAAPQSYTDPIESHPYLYTHYFSHRFDPPREEMLAYFFDTIRIPHNDANEHSSPADGSYFENPVLINEYCWLWMNRNGTTTRLTDAIFANAFGDQLSMEEKYELYARHLAIMTEYWRAHRTAAGVQHFCGLGYSRPLEPRGETSDNFSDINKLFFEPNFTRFVRPAFSPVGLMLDIWENSFQAGLKYDRQLYLINDLKEPWEGMVKVFFEKDGALCNAISLDLKAAGYESGSHSFSFMAPSISGTYDMVAEILYMGEPVRSVREIIIE